METVRCNYCGADDTVLVNHGPDLLLNRPGDFKLVRCQQCALIYQNPRPTLEELPNYYPDDYDPYERGVVDQLSTWQTLNRTHEMSRRCHRIEKRFAQPGTLLDVGCATGLFLVAMRQRGWQVQGVELSHYAADYARQTHDLTVHTGTLETAAFPDNTFEAVTLWDVLEHVIDPKETMREIGRILKPGGLFVASVPNPDAIEAKLFKDKWVGWDRPRHLHIFSEPVIKRYLVDTGFELDEIETIGGRLALTLMSMDFVMHARDVPAEKWRPWRAFLYNPLFRLATWPLYRLAGALNKLTIMTVFARVQK